MKKNMNYEDAVVFHGHSCPGLAIGFRAAEVGLRELYGSRAVDEELVAIVENDACGVDAVQWMTGCTFGKGNLIFRDYGKMAFTFFNRKTGNGVRVYVDSSSFYSEDDDRFQELKANRNRTAEENEEMAGMMKQRCRRVLEMPEKEFIRVTEPQEPMPSKARLFDSIRCHLCGEKAMETRSYKQGEHSYCTPCFNTVS
jgi:formylmethanofuran dehydrogenase subunit E